MEISKEDAKWMLGVYAPIKEYGMVSKWIDHHIQAMSIIKGHPVNKPSCSCEFGAYARMASNMFDQHKAQIELAAQEEVVEQEVVKKTRGRKKSGI